MTTQLQLATTDERRARLGSTDSESLGVLKEVTPPRQRQKKRRLRLEYSGNLVKHLGLSMYGGAVPAIAELVANAYDADSKIVEITLPLDKPILDTDVMTIKDYGRGMSWEDVALHYLVIGRNRRVGGREITKLGRHVMGRKGIGKLAGFGIARIVEIRTVRNRWVTHFSMDFGLMTSDSAPRARYEPEIIADEAISERNSTTVILRNLSLKRAIVGKQFHEGLARRFAVLNADFKILVNDEAISKIEMPTRIRIPPGAGELQTVNVEGFGEVKARGTRPMRSRISGSSKRAHGARADGTNQLIQSFAGRPF